MAFTATATPSVQADIVAQLSMVKPLNSFMDSGAPTWRSRWWNFRYRIEPGTIARLLARS